MFRFSLKLLENGSFIKIHAISEDKNSKRLEKFNRDYWYFLCMFSLLYIMQRIGFTLKTDPLRT